MTEKSIFGQALNIGVGLAVAYTFRHIIIGLFIFAPLLLLMFYSPAFAIVSLLIVILPTLDKIQNNENNSAGNIISDGVFIGLVWFMYLMFAIMTI